MKKLLFLAIIILALNATACVPQRSKEKNNVLPLTKTNMVISSPVFKNKGLMPVKYTCDGADVNPPLIISDVPEGAKSLVLIVDDPDAPAGTWVHWTVWNINPKTEEIAENSVPADSVEGITSFGKYGYGGPCPPSGAHRYFFKLYALDTALDLDKEAKAPDIEEAMAGHVLAKAELMGKYSRQ